MPKISVVIPSNRWEFIAEALQSLKEQTVQPYEILYNFSQNLGCAEKVNRLVSIAEGDFIIFLCDDDKLEPMYIEEVSKYINHDIVYTDLQKFDKDNSMLMAQDWNAMAFKLSTVPFITSMVSREMFLKVGGWDKEQIYQDYDFWYRCFKAGATAFHLEKPLFLYRVHFNNLTSQVPDKVARDLVLNKHPELK